MKYKTSDIDKLLKQGVPYAILFCMFKIFHNNK